MDGRGKQPAKQGAKVRVRSADKYAHVAKQDYCRRTRGRAPAGQRAVVALPGSKGPNVHVIGAITNFQVVKWSRLRGAFRSQSAKDWLADMLQHLPQGSTSTYK